MNIAKNISRIILDILFFLFYSYFNKFFNFKNKNGENMTKTELNKILEIGSEIGLTFFEKAVQDGYTFENAKITAAFALHNLGFKKLFIDSFLKNLKPNK